MASGAFGVPFPFPLSGLSAPSSLRIKSSGLMDALRPFAVVLLTGDLILSSKGRGDDPSPISLPVSLVRVADADDGRDAGIGGGGRLL